MRRLGLYVAVAALPLVGCSLFVSLDGLSEIDGGNNVNDGGSLSDVTSSSDVVVANDAGKQDGSVILGDAAEVSLDGGLTTEQLCKTHTKCWTFDDSTMVPADLETPSPVGTLSVVAQGKSKPNALMATTTLFSSTEYYGAAYYETSNATVESHLYVSYYLPGDASGKVTSAYYARLGLGAASPSSNYCEFYLRIGPPGASTDSQSAILVLPNGGAATETIPIASSGVADSWNDILFEVVHDGTGLRASASFNGADPTTWNDTGNECYFGGGTYFYAGLSGVPTNTQTIVMDDLSFDTK